MGKVNELFRSGLNSRKQLAVLIDPDTTGHLPALLSAIRSTPPDFIFTGGSIHGEEYLGALIAEIRKYVDIPVVIFPGNTSQINKTADALLLLSVISSRNADLLIGKHVEAAFRLKSSGLEIIPTGYMLIESGSMTAVQYVSQSLPIPRSKPGIAAATALAGEQLGMQTFYLEAGSGASETVPDAIIKTVKAVVSGIVICGGGISQPEQLEKIYSAGADIAVIGTELERNPDSLSSYIKMRNKFNTL